MAEKSVPTDSIPRKSKVKKICAIGQTWFIAVEYRPTMEELLSGQVHKKGVENVEDPPQQDEAKKGKVGFQQQDNLSQNVTHNVPLIL